MCRRHKRELSEGPVDLNARIPHSSWRCFSWLDSLSAKLKSPMATGSQNREKWHGALPNLKLNALVSLANENISQGRRNLGRIGQKLRPLEGNYKDLWVLHDVGHSTLGVPWGAECLGTNVVLVNTFQDFSSVSLVFSHQFSNEISLHGKKVARAL